MKHRPDGRELLIEARRTFKERLLPALPDDLRYDALMVINALGVAAREWATDATETAALLESVNALLGDDGPAPSVAEAERRLARAIRAGHFDAHTHRETLLDALGALTRARLQVDNPKQLEQRPRSI